MHFNPHTCSKRIVNSLETESLDAFERCVKKNKAGINATYSAKIWTNIIETNYYPIHYAVLNGDVDKVKVLIDNGAEIDKLDPAVQRTPLMFTLGSWHRNRFIVANYLIDNGADVFFEDRYGDTIIEKSTLVDCRIPDEVHAGAELTKRLIELTGYGKNYFTKEPLILSASRNGNNELIDYLISNRIDDINAADESGVTALMMALEKKPFDENQEEIVKYLLKNGADKSMSDSDGKTAYDYAVQLKNERIISLLEEN